MILRNNTEISGTIRFDKRIHSAVNPVELRDMPNVSTSMRTNLKRGLALSSVVRPVRNEYSTIHEWQLRQIT
jgi:hypothetical protein